METQCSAPEEGGPAGQGSLMATPASEKPERREPQFTMSPKQHRILVTVLIRKRVTIKR